MTDERPPFDREAHDARMAAYEAQKRWVIYLWVIGVAVVLALGLLGWLP